jgi:SAM-dependent methyltransferase
MNFKKIGNFGSLVKNYEKARKGYPTEVIEYLKKEIKVTKPLILDLGCGTGIASRQLVEIGKVVGCDKNRVMLAHAKKHNTNKIKYVLGSAEKLPFKDNTFDVVTSFSSFHWFNNKKSLRQIKRVLKPDGVLFIVNKRGLIKWSKGYLQAITNAINKNLTGFGSRKDIKSSVKNAGFAKVKSKEFDYSEFFTVNRAVEFVQSNSVWNSVPNKLRPRAVDALKGYFNKIQKNGSIERKMPVKIVIAKRP